jgi:hypothetical protein
MFHKRINITDGENFLLEYCAEVLSKSTGNKVSVESIHTDNVKKALCYNILHNGGVMEQPYETSRQSLLVKFGESHDT